MSENRNFSIGGDPQNQNEPAKEPEAPNAKNNDDQSVNMDEDEMMSSDEEDIIDTKDASNQNSCLDVEKGITPGNKKIGDQNLKFGSSFTQNIGKGNELEKTSGVLLNPNDVILEEVFSNDDNGTTAIQQQTAAFQEKQILQEQIKQDGNIYENSNQDVKIGDKKSKSGRSSGRDSQRKKKSGKSGSLNSLNQSQNYKPDDVPDDGHEEEATDKRSKFLKFAIPGFVVTFILVIMLVSFLALQGNDDKIISSKADTTDYKTIAAVTAKCYFDISIDGTAQGKITMGLFGNEVPQTVRNFKELCSGSFGKSKQITSQDLSYTNSKFYMVNKQQAIGGDIISNNGAGGESIYGKSFPNENYLLKHSVPYLLSTYSPTDASTSSSQFIITFEPTPWFNGKNVVFGQIIDGFNVIQAIQNQATASGSPTKPLLISQSGEIPMQ